MAQRSGFFNALKVGNEYDRKYNANDYSDNMGAIISDGVRRSGDDDLKVTAAGGMALNVAVGRAWIKGRWYINDAIFTDFSVPTAPTGDRSRIDRIVLRLDQNAGSFGDGERRAILLDYKPGEASISPAAPALTREGGIWEIALADILVGPGVTTITQGNITDQRANTEVCGWITTPVGYDDYFTSLDGAFDDWFSEKKDTLASVTLFKKYEQHITTESETSTVTVEIAQYDPTGVDILEVYINGLRGAEGIDYTKSGKVITFSGPKIAGTDIQIVVYKSIDGTGLGSVSDEVAELQQEMSTVKNIGDYIYICNGVDDNVKLSEIAQEFLGNDTDYSQMIISVYGTFGYSGTVGGEGTSTSRARFFALGGSGTTKRKIVFDFEGCFVIPENTTSDFTGWGSTSRMRTLWSITRTRKGHFKCSRQISAIVRLKTAVSGLTPIPDPSLRKPERLRIAGAG